VEIIGCRRQRAVAGHTRGRVPEPAASGRGGSGGRHEGFRRAVAALDSEE
jgi:hypothetical protein